MSSHTFEQFVRFTTDAAGLERTFRLFQSIAQILASYTLPFNILLFLLSFLPTSTTTSTSSPGAGANGKAFPDAVTTHAVLLGLRANFNIARRYFRLFRFLESFGAAQKLYTSIQRLDSKDGINTTTGGNAGGSRSRWGTTPLWIDVFGRTFNGMYLLLEATTILDVQRIPGLSVWGPELEPLVAVEGQRFWLFSLVCGVLAGGMRLSDLVLPLPLDGPADKKEEVEVEVEVDADEKEEKSERKKSREEQKAMAKADQLAEQREIRAKISNLTRRVMSDALDITLPGSVVGWVPASTGTVGLAMFVTTILTSMDIWERCGREVVSSKK